MINKRHSIFIIIFALVLLTACSSEKNSKQTGGQATEQLGKTSSQEFKIRPAPQGGTSAAYFSYLNSTETRDTLLSVESEIAELAQVHETYQDEEGMMGMREIKNLTVDAGEELIFERGGLHIMLMQLRHDVVEGDSVDIVLEFSQSGQHTITLRVKS